MPLTYIQVAWGNVHIESNKNLSFGQQQVRTVTTDRVTDALLL